MYRELKFKIVYQKGETGYITSKIITLGDPIPRLGNDWGVISKLQFTGLKDKHGAGIYEGDILQRFKKSGEPYKQVKIVEYRYDGYVNLTNLSESVVIGTIHEHEHLLEGAK